jgi:hypothetical protein
LPFFFCFFVGRIDEGGFRGVEAFIALDDDIRMAELSSCILFSFHWNVVAL